MRTSGFKRDEDNYTTRSRLASRISRKPRDGAETLRKALGLIERDVEGDRKNVVHQIDIFHRHVLRDRYAGRREVDDAADPRLDQVVGRTLGTFGRRGNDSDFDVEFVNLFFETAGADDFESGDLLPDLEGIAVEGTDEDKAAATKYPVPKQRPTQVTDADKCDIPRTINAQRLLDRRKKILNIIPDASNAELAKISKILTYLRRVDPARLGQSVRRYDRFPS